MSVFETPERELTSRLAVQPATARQVNYSFGRTPAHLPPKPAKSKGQPYVRGMYAALVPELRPAPDEATGATIRVAASGRSLVVEEQLITGIKPKRLVELEGVKFGEIVYSLDVRLPNGEEVSIEVRRYQSAAINEQEFEEFVRHQRQQNEPDPEDQEMPVDGTDDVLPIDVQDVQPAITLSVPATPATPAIPIVQADLADRATQPAAHHYTPCNLLSMLRKG